MTALPVHGRSEPPAGAPGAGGPRQRFVWVKPPSGPSAPWAPESRPTTRDGNEVAFQQEDGLTGPSRVRGEVRDLV